MIAATTALRCGDFASALVFYAAYNTLHCPTRMVGTLEFSRFTQAPVTRHHLEVLDPEVNSIEFRRSLPGLNDGFHAGSTFIFCGFDELLVGGLRSFNCDRVSRHSL